MADIDDRLILQTGSLRTGADYAIAADVQWIGGTFWWLGIVPGEKYTVFFVLIDDLKVLLTVTDVILNVSGIAGSNG